MINKQSELVERFYRYVAVLLKAFPTAEPQFPAVKANGTWQNYYSKNARRLAWLTYT